MVVKCRCPPKRSRRARERVVELIDARRELGFGRDHFQQVWEIAVDGMTVDVHYDEMLKDWSVKAGPDGEWFIYTRLEDLLRPREYLRPYIR